MTTIQRLTLAILTLVSLSLPAFAQNNDEPLVIGTVHRPPFAFTDGDKIDGFSIELMREIANILDRDLVFEPYDRFGDMLANTRSGHIDGAIANISITAERERIMDFSQPIFGGGIQILLPLDVGVTGQVFGLLNTDVLIAVAAGFAILFLIGLLMWVFERNKQPFFDRPAKEAMFPSFWWALNLIVNGGFEERMPRSVPGRILAVILVVASLFFVSIFVAMITASATVNALQTQVSSIRDLETRSVGTIAGSTSATFLDANGIHFQGFGNLDRLLEAFERDDINTVVFDGPILAYYVQNDGAGVGKLIDKVYRPENYGIVLPTGSPLKEGIDQALLELRESGVYDSILTKWFGNSYVVE